MSGQIYENRAYSESSTYLEPEYEYRTPRSPPHEYESLDPSTQAPAPRPADRSPGEGGCKSPPWWGWALIVIGVLLLVAVIAAPVVTSLLNGKATSGGGTLGPDPSLTATATPTPAGPAPTPAGPAPMPAGPASTPTTAPPLIPTRGDYIMQCEIPGGQGGSTHVTDLCWVDATTLVAVLRFALQVVMFRINNQGCTYTIIDSGYRASRVACNIHTKMVYITDDVRVIIYNFNNPGDPVQWHPQGVQDPHHISVNGQNIAVAGRDTTHVSVYTLQKREFLYQLQVFTSPVVIQQTYLTASGEWLATLFYNHHLLIYELRSNVSYRVGGVGRADGQLTGPTGVSGGPKDGSVMVCDRGNYRISVWSLQGVFVSQLTLVGKQVTWPITISVVDRPGESSLMALSTEYNNDTSELFIYSLH